MWPTGGNKTIVSINNGIVKHYWFEPEQYKEAAEKVVELAAQDIDVYYALAGFTGNERKQEQVAAVKCLWSDLDIGDTPEKYPTREDAVKAFGGFLNTTSLPVPIIVSSGYGMHTYWPLDADVTFADWHVMATALKKLEITHGLKADLKCTSDAARILRPIGTFNHKNGAPRPVKLATNGEIHVDSDKVKEALVGHGNEKSDPFESIAAQTVGKSDPTVTSFTSAIPADFDQILTKCATVRWGYENQGEVSEPFWYDLLGVAGFCSGGSTDAHRISNRHPQYDSNTTEKKTRQRIGAAGPTTCAQFKSNTQSHCTGCPHSITTPLQLGQPRNVVPIISVKQTSGGQRFWHSSLKLDNSGFYINMPTAKDKDGNQSYDWIKINKHGLTPLLELRQPDSNGTPSNFVWFEVYNDLGETVNSFITPSQGIANSMQFSTDCSKNGYYFESESAPTAYKKYHKIMRTWVEEMKAQQGSIVTFRSFGWTGPDSATQEKQNSFLLGNTLYSKDGSAHATPYIPTLASFQNDFVSKGSLDEWIKAMDNYNIPGMEAQMFATWIAWGSPLMRFTTAGTIVFHIIGDTGVGKTSLQRSIISTYGDYNSKQLLDVNTSTMNSMGKTMGLLNSIPYCKEELTEADAKDLASWALTATQGREKQRMNQSNGIAQVSTWNMIACTSANQSLREIIVTQRHDSAARLARVWEQEVELPIKQFEASRLFAPLKRNYGLAGHVFIPYIVQNMSMIQDLIVEKEEELSIKLRGEGVDRFHISMLTACFVGVQIAKLLGLTNHDIPRGMKYAIEQFKRLKQSAHNEKQSAEQNLALFMQDVQPHTLAVEFDYPNTAKTIFNSDNNVIRCPSSTQSIHMRYAKSSSMFYATIVFIRRWYADHHINFESDMKHLENAGILTERNKRVVLTKGTKLSDDKQTMAMWFDISKSSVLIEAAQQEEGK
jgi:hypothetical protein